MADLVSMDDFLQAVAAALDSNPGWREGQALFNVLTRVRPGLSAQIVMTARDPYTLNEQIPAFLEWIDIRGTGPDAQSANSGSLVAISSVAAFGLRRSRPERTPMLRRATRTRARPRRSYGTDSASPRIQSRVSRFMGLGWLLRRRATRRVARPATCLKPKAHCMCPTGHDRTSHGPDHRSGPAPSRGR